MVLRKLLEPESIAVIGASRERKSVGNIIFRNCLKSKCKAFPINPNAEQIAGEEAYDSVLDVEDELDLVVIAVPAKIIPKVLGECKEKDIKLAAIISGGFSEMGEEGEKLKQEIAKIAKENHIRILGPNILGSIIPSKHINYSFFEGEPKEGNIAFISQSGALGASIMDWSIDKGIGFSSFISVGNRMDIKFPELVSLLDRDKDTEVICLYIESLSNGREFMDICKKTEKPIIALKAGKSKHGKKASQSHTGSLAGDDKIFSAVFDQVGVIEVVNLKEMFNIASFLVNDRRPEGNRLCVISNTGGLGVVTADLANSYGLEVPELPNKLKEELDKILPKYWNQMNPIDVIGDATHQRYKKVLDKLKKYQFYDSLMVMLTPQGAISPVKAAKEVLQFHKTTEVPITTCFIGGKDAKAAERILERENIPNFFEPEDGIRLMAKSRVE